MTAQTRAVRQVALDLSLMLFLFTILGFVLTHRWPQWWYYAVIVVYAAYRYVTLLRKYERTTADG